MKKIDYFIKKYLENRPMFMAIIRSQEAVLFQKYNKLIKEKILDFGCGDGFFAEVVFGKKRINVGLDLIKNKRVKEAKKEGIYKKTTYYDGNIIPYPSNYFDTIISNCVLEHIPKINSSLKEIYRVLKPGGYFLTTVMTNNWNDYLFGKKILSNYYVNYMKKIQVHLNLFSYDQWIRTIENSNLKIIKIDGYLYKNSSCYLDFFHYLSIGSLINYKLFNKWILFSNPFLNKIKTKFIKKTITYDDNPSKASALFFLLKK